MSADSFRLLWSCIAFWLAGVSAPQVLAGASWGEALARNITAGLFGILATGFVVGAVYLTSEMFKALKRRYTAHLA